MNKLNLKLRDNMTMWQMKEMVGNIATVIDPLSSLGYINMNWFVWRYFHEDS
jgi:hypothetical protein